MSQPYLIKAEKLFTMVEGNEVQQRQGILIHEGRIKTVADWGEFTPHDRWKVLDAENSVVLPGLIDAHTHIVQSGEPDDDPRLTLLSQSAATTALRATQHARRHLHYGVTTIRDLGARDWVDVALRDAIHAGWQEGPRMLVAGHGITSSGGHMDFRKHLRPDFQGSLSGIGTVIDGPDQARKAAWEQLMYGADVLKLNATLSEYVRAQGGRCSPELTYEAMQAICEVAHNTGRKVAAHCHGGAGVKAALEAGVDTLEHGRFLDDALLERMAKDNIFLVPTLSPEARRVDHRDPPHDPATRRWYETATDIMYKTVAKAREHGVNIAAGSDAGMPYVRHGDIAYEIYHLSQAGLSTREALASATRIAAEALGLANEIGQVREGFSADLIVLAQDPEENLTSLQHSETIRTVIRQGQIVSSTNR